MNFNLKWYVLGAYILLIVLLMLANCHGCDRGVDEEEAPYADTVAVVDDETREQQASQTGQTGRIKVTALWDFPGDVDLHLLEPNGEEIWYRNMRDSRTGAELDVDNTQGGRGSAENIFITTPKDGRYVVSLVMYRLSDDAPHGGEVTVVIKVDDIVQQYRVVLRSTGQTETVKIFNYPTT